MFVTDMLTAEWELVSSHKKLKTDIQVISSTPSPSPRYSNELPILGKNDDVVAPEPVTGVYKPLIKVGFYWLGKTPLTH